MTNEDKVCPGCHIAQPDDAWADLPVRLCRFCVADLTREVKR